MSKSAKLLIVMLTLALVVLASLVAAGPLARRHEIRKLKQSYRIYYLTDSGNFLERLLGECEPNPLDLQKAIEDLGLETHPNPYNHNRPTVYTSPDVFIPWAVWHIPGPQECLDDYAVGLFLNKKTAGEDFWAEEDNLWIKAHGYSEPDGISDGFDKWKGYGCWPDMKPWEHRDNKLWQPSGHDWRLPNGELLYKNWDEFLLIYRQYVKDHPENFDVSKRPRKPDWLKEDSPGPPADGRERDTHPSDTTFREI